MITVISLGGSIVAPDDVDIPYIHALVQTIRTYLSENSQRKILLIIGGGGPARRYQRAYRELCSEADNDAQDWIGIMATRLNAELIRAVFNKECTSEVVTDPTADFDFPGQILVAAGWKPGFSTDFDAVMLAERFSANRIINLSNIEKVYTADPKIDPNALPLDYISWDDFSLMVGSVWTPGKNTPFDPIATAKAKEMNLQVIAAGGRDLPNFSKILHGEESVCTIIGRK